MPRPLSDWLPDAVRQTESRGIALLVLLFCGALAPYAAFFLTHHPDERHYTDAGIEMVRRGDYLTPYTPNGDLRLKKPIIPYWMTAVSYRLLGISPWSSRLPFLLAGGAVVWLTYRLAWMLLDDRGMALLAACVVSCNPSLLISSPRSIPDIALGLFLLLSALGFVALAKSGQSRWRDVAAAYGGGALAALSKGLPGVVFVGYATAFLVLWPAVRRRQQWSRHGAALGVATLLAIGWYALMYRLHGDALLAMFFRDQVGERVARSATEGVRHFGAILLLIGLCYLPWIAPLAMSRFDGRSFARQCVRQPEWALLLGWTAIWVCLASMVERVNLRYLLPVAPLLSVLAARAWKEADATRLLRAAQPGWRLAVAAFGMTAAASAASAAWAGYAWAGAAVLAGAAVTVRALIQLRTQAGIVGLAAQATTACLLMLAVASVGLAPWILPEAGSRIAHELRRLPLPGEGPARIVFVGKPAVAARARVMLQGELPLWHAYRPTPEVLREAEVVLLSQEDAQALGPEWTAIHVFEHGHRGFQAPDLLRAAARGELAAFLQSHRRTIAIATRRSHVDASHVQTASWNSESSDQPTFTR